MINIYEKPIMPTIDTDSDVVVYLPCFATKGPEEPTLVSSGNFSSIFGGSAYIFKETQEPTAALKNTILAGKGDRSWYYGKGLSDAGLTLLVHRYKPEDAVYPRTENAFSILNGSTATDLEFFVKSKYFGLSYTGYEVSFVAKTNGVSTITVSNENGNVLETANISLDPTASNYLGDYEFSNISIYTKVGAKIIDGLDGVNLTDYFKTNPTAILYVNGKQELKALKEDGTAVDTTEDEFNINKFILAMESMDFFKDLYDYDRYPVSYISSGGYFINEKVAGVLLSVASKIKAYAPIDLPDEIPSLTALATLKNKLATIPTNDTLDKSFGDFSVGCDTYVVNGVKLILPESYGYFAKLAGNIRNGIPYWVPVANNSQGNYSTGVSTTRPINRELAEEMTGDIGCSINPIVYKQNIGFVCMGNRTLFPNSGVLGPQSFKNCRIVVNAIERSARTSASSLRIASTNPITTFKLFRNAVSKTADKFLTNGDGLASYSIDLLPKTKPATIDIRISLVVVEGIETFNIFLEYSLAID